MIRHIVMFKIKDEESEDIKKENLMHLKKMIDDLKITVPQIHKLETGINFSTRPVAYDLVLISEFHTPEDLETYLSHDEHQKMAEYLGTIRQSVAMVDYYF